MSDQEFDEVLYEWETHPWLDAVGTFLLVFGPFVVVGLILHYLFV